MFYMYKIKWSKNRFSVLCSKHLRKTHGCIRVQSFQSGVSPLLRGKLEFKVTSLFKCL